MHAVMTALIPVLSRGEPTSVAALARKVGAPPETIETALCELDALGLAIERALDEVRCPAFAPLDSAVLQASLDGAAGQGRWDARTVAVTGSTNSDLLALARAGALGRPTVLAAELQRQGRGRLGRAWHGAPGASLTASFALAIDRPLAALEGVTLVCGLASQAVLVAHGVPAVLKWPNDVLLDGRKLAGILVEVHRQAGITVLVIGIGFNVLPRAGHADLQTAGCDLLDRNRLAAALAIALDREIERFARAGFAPFVSAWNAIDAFCDRRVELRANDGAPVVHGIARGVDDSGALLLEIDGNVRRHIAGDLSLRLAASEVRA